MPRSLRTAEKEAPVKPDLEPRAREAHAVEMTSPVRHIWDVQVSSGSDLDVAADNDISGDTAPERSRLNARSALASYLWEVRRYPLLSREDEHELAVLFAKTGDSALAARLINANLRLVVKLALEYRAARGNLLDLVQEGNVGLIVAVQKYDPHRGVKLSTYAGWWIRAYMLKFILSNSRLVRIGTTRVERRLFFGLRKERAKREARGGGGEAKELAAALNVSESKVIEMEQRLTSCEASLDSPVRQQEDQGDRTYGDFVPAESCLRPDYQAEEAEFSELLRLRLEEFGETLSGRDIEVFRRRFLSEDAATLAMMARTFGVSRERVRQIEERLKKRLRRYLKASLGDAIRMTSFMN
jgi:RNA polymerase sigma-32 factor